MVEATLEVLLPEPRDAVEKALREDPVQHDGLHGVDPWAMVDDQVRRASELDRTAEMVRAHRAATVACQAYQRTRGTRHLRDAVAHLESAVDAMRRPLCAGVPMDACAEQADRLGAALREALPASAFRFFVAGVRGAIEDQLDHVGRAHLNQVSQPDHWLSREAWTVEDPGDERSVGVWFIDEVQQGYDAEMDAQRLADEADRSRRAEDDERLRRWQARRDEERKVALSADPEEPHIVSEPVETEAPIEPRHEDAVIPVLTQIDELDDRHNVAWPAHVEHNERYWAEVIRKNEAEYAEMVVEQALLDANEAERLRVEAANKEAEDAFKARAALKASPARIQSRW